MSARQLNFVDQLLGNADRALRTLVPGTTQATRRPAGETFAKSKSAPQASPSTENMHTAGLMRINHTGEVCAQALYQGQAATAKLPHVRARMEQSALEEEDHLAWCEERLRDFGSHTSRLNPLFYGASFALGALAGLAGDRWSLGFVAETERQVVSHLESHMTQIPFDDKKTHAILMQMREDEQHHAVTASDAGGSALPASLKRIMTLTSRLMTWSTYRV